MIVVDASTLIEVLLQTVAGKDVGKRWFSPGQALHGPHLIDVEVIQVIRRLVGTNEVGGQRGGLAVEALWQFPLKRHAPYLGLAAQSHRL